MNNLESILLKFQEFVSPEFCNHLAKTCGFVQRSTSKIQGYEFAQAMMIPNAFIEAETLNSLSVRMRAINKICNISACALAQRMNTKQAERYMKACFGKVLKETVKKDVMEVSDLQNLTEFKRVLIEDSTRAELNEKLSPHFKGSGGVASKASVKIDFVFDYLSEEIIDIDFCSGHIPDQSLAGRIIPMLNKDDLVIRDLGYFVLKDLKGIEDQGAWYISRWKVNEHVYESKEAKHPLDLGKFLDRNMLDELVDLEVFIGKEKHPVRLVACLMSEDAINKRLREANRSAQRHGTTISKKKKELLKYAIFITNVLETRLSSESVMAIYRARWRIELIFKQWKSCLKLHLFKGYNVERFRCFLYGRMVMVLLIGSLSASLMKYAHKLKRELSSHKLTNYLIADQAFARAFQEGRVGQFMEKLIEDLPGKLCKDKRKRPTLRENVRMNNSYYNNMKIKELKENAA